MATTVAISRAASPGKSKTRWSLLLLLAAALPACSFDIVPSLQGGGTGFLYSGGIRPDRRVIGIGETRVYEYFVYDSRIDRDVTEFGTVTWSNEMPAVLGLVPGAGCSDRQGHCVTVNGLTPGDAQIRAFAVIDGARVDASAQLVVR